MTSSPQDGAGPLVESPAPPAFSPLTDPIQPTREPSVIANLDESAAQDLGSTHLPADLNASHDPSLPLNHANDLLGNQLPQAALDPAAMSYVRPSFGEQSATEIYPQQAQILMALARISSAQGPNPNLQPSTVRPSQVSISDAVNHEPNAVHNGPRVPPVDSALESFARIEFADSVFQMTTYAVIIGRDQRALEQARKDERREEEYQRRCEEYQNMGLPPPSPPRQDRGKFSKSYVSEEGGMLGPESDGDDNPRPNRKRKYSRNGGSASGDAPLPNKRMKTSGNGDSLSGESLIPPETAAPEQAAQDDTDLIVNRQYISHTPGAAAVNLSALRPSPYHIPFIGIHSPGPNIASRTKAISREHLKIQFNPDTGVFEAIPLHKNGFFIGDVHYKEDKAVLKSGDLLQIKDVQFGFVINGVPRGKTGAEEYLEEEASNRRYSEGGKEMSFEFESNHGREKLRSTSPEEGAVQVDVEDSGSDSSELVDEDMAEAAEGDSGVMETIERDVEPDQGAAQPGLDLAALAQLPQVPVKRRGPGRPPKNGIMSKREERLRKKAMMEEAKKNMPPPPPGEPPVKRKVGRPRKHPLPEDAPNRVEKRKYKPRKKNGEEGGESDPEGAVKERRREKPKTPPLELRREDYNDEQLQKPNKNYGVLIDEVLSAAPDGLTLKQIYKRIQMNYPFYYFTVDTKGWESSVRHNLIGNDAFKKNSETHLWSRVPGIDIDSGKKRKAASPDQATVLQNVGQQQYPQNPPHAAAPHAEPPRYPPAGTPQHVTYTASHSPSIPGQHAAHQQFHTPSPMSAQPRQSYATPGQAQIPAQAPGYQNPPSAQGASYSAQYTKPSPTASAQPNNNVPRQYTQPQGGPVPNGLPRASQPAAGPGTTNNARPSQTLATVPLKPPVSEELTEHVANFKETVAAQLATRSENCRAVALSAARRGLGLTSMCTVVGNDQSLEKIVFGVFEKTKTKLGVNQALHPKLLHALLDFKARILVTLGGSLGALKAELLVLSAFDQVLGFEKKSTMEGNEAEMLEFQKAENVLVPVLTNMVLEHRKAITKEALATASQPPAQGIQPAPVPQASQASQARTAGPAPSATPSPAAQPGAHPVAQRGKGVSTPAPPARAPQITAAATQSMASSPVFSAAIQKVSPIPQTAVVPVTAPLSASVVSGAPPIPTTAVVPPITSCAPTYIQSPVPPASTSAAPMAPRPSPTVYTSVSASPLAASVPIPAVAPSPAPTPAPAAAPTAPAPAVPTSASVSTPTPASTSGPVSVAAPSEPALHPAKAIAPGSAEIPSTAGAAGGVVSGGPATHTMGTAAPTATAQ